MNENLSIYDKRRDCLERFSLGDPAAAVDMVREIEQLRKLVCELHEPAWRELGLFCEDIDNKYRDVLDRALLATN